MAYNNGDVDPRAFLQEVGVYACSPIFSDPILKIQAVQKVNTELIMNLTSVSDNHFSCNVHFEKETWIPRLLQYTAYDVAEHTKKLL